MNESLIPGEQGLTSRLRYRVAMQCVEALRAHGHTSFCIATIIASLSCLPGCASPYGMFGAQPTPSIVGAPQRPQMHSQVGTKRQLPSSRNNAQRPAQQSESAAEQLAESIRQSGDNQRMPFIIIDKVGASIAAYNADGRLIGIAPALLGAARGDHSVPGIGERPIAKILPHERTTPAGRFIAEMGRNMQGEDIVWIDYDNAISLHRVRANNASERRLERLASSTPSDNRISYGCINIPARYFDGVVKPLIKDGKAVAYILPEVRSTADVFSFVRTNPASQARQNDQNGNRANRPG